MAIDFVLYCMGCSLVFVAVALAIRMIRPPAPIRVKKNVATEKDQVSGTDDLGERLKEFQSARFGLPIVRRQLDQNSPAFARMNAQIEAAVRRRKNDKED